MIQINFGVSLASDSVVPDQASVILSASDSPNKNVVIFASPNPSGNIMDAKLVWDIWHNHYGPILVGTTFDVSVVVGALSPEIAIQQKIATLTYVQSRDKVVVTQAPPGSRVAAAAAALAPKKEIVHQQRPEHVMISPIISGAYSIVVILPTAIAISAMIHQGANAKGFFGATVQAQSLSVFFHGGIAAILVIQLGYWLQFNLLQILPILATCEFITLIIGIKLAAVMSATPAASESSAQSLSASSKKNL